MCTLQGNLLDLWTVECAHYRVISWTCGPWNVHITGSSLGLVDRGMCTLQGNLLDL